MTNLHKIVHISPVNLSPAYNSTAGDITAFYSKWTKCHTSSFINSNPFDHKSFNLVSRQVRSWQNSSEWDEKHLLIWKLIWCKGSILHMFKCKTSWEIFMFIFVYLYYSAGIWIHTPASTSISILMCLLWSCSKGAAGWKPVPLFFNLSELFCLLVPGHHGTSNRVVFLVLLLLSIVANHL